jgi:hypothetical protein
VLTGTALTTPSYRFLHRTIHEYLVATYLASLSSEDALPQLRPHFWYDLAWEEVILLYAGAVDDPGPLLEALLAEPDDVFHTMLLLSGWCLVEAGKGYDGPARHAIVTRPQHVQHSSSVDERIEASRVLVTLGVVAARETALQDPDWRVRQAMVEVLGGQVGTVVSGYSDLRFLLYRVCPMERSYIVVEMP